jgi:hypothetical protein
MNITIVAPVTSISDIRVFQKEAKSLAANGYQLPSSPGQIVLVGRWCQILPAPASDRLKRFVVVRRVQVSVGPACRHLSLA